LLFLQVQCEGGIEQGKDFFFEKKKQKTFICSASASPERLGPDLQKFFGSFFQKRTFLLQPLTFHESSAFAISLRTRLDTMASK
jgi:hypothetical protein